MTRRRRIAFASLLIFGLSVALFIVTKMAEFSLSSTLYSNLLIAVAAIGGAVAFLAGFKDVVELVERLTEKPNVSLATEPEPKANTLNWVGTSHDALLSDKPYQGEYLDFGHFWQGDRLT